MKGLTIWEQNAYRRLYPQGSALLDEANVFVRHEACGCGIAVEPQPQGLCVRLGANASFGRALLLAEEAAAGQRAAPLREAPAYQRLGLLVDCSRGAVPTVQTLKELLCKLAKMGYNSLQLYMEDTCALKEYPYLGYQRGAYSREELRAIDAFGCAVGVAVIPAVQTLAHMGQALKWPAFADMVDAEGILLIGEEKTYAFLDALFEHLSGCFTCKQINLGMDEAHFVGLGKYLDRHGYQNRLQVMMSHFKRVYALAKKHGLQPMMWSDMFFRLATGGEYYDPAAPIDPAVAEQLPKDVKLLYWDYYSEQQSVYDAMLDKHRQLTKNLAFAGGAWKWRGFGPNNQFSMKVANLAHQSCLAHGIDEVLVTAWGDNGAECALFSILPALQYWAELCYGGDSACLHSRFARCCCGDWEQFMLLDQPNFTPHNPAPGRCEVNPAKYLLYQDVLCGVFDAHVEPKRYAEHFAQCQTRLKAAAESGPAPWKYLFETQALLCGVLEKKCGMGVELRRAYQQGDEERLREIAERQLPALREALNAFYSAFCRQWQKENKIAGLDVLDLRFGGLDMRLRRAEKRIDAYLRGEATALEELEAMPLPYDGKVRQAGVRDIAGPFWHRIVSAANISSI